MAYDTNDADICNITDMSFMSVGRVCLEVCYWFGVIGEAKVGDIIQLINANSIQPIG